MSEENLKEMLAGLDRNLLHWNPTISKEMCSNCQACFKFCKHGVYAIIEK
jgi:Pyruvate/2-oxoacid:ferredoxin oxidoreductase delta subunit